MPRMSVSLSVSFTKVLYIFALVLERVGKPTTINHPGFKLEYNVLKTT